MHPCTCASEVHARGSCETTCTPVVLKTARGTSSILARACASCKKQHTAQALSSPEAEQGGPPHHG
eukprot:39342-Chlamydomonas_euryale.AAC.2